jgi:hypothetical protein
MSSGKRYNSQKPKLNIKKVIAAVIVLAVIIMAITGIVKVFTGGSKSEEKTIPNRYFAVYTNNKWGVINSKGETVIKPQYDEAIIIPDNSKAIFICTYDVDYSKNTYKTKVVNAKNEEIIKGYDSITALENYDNENNIWYENDVLLASKDGKFGLVDFKGKELLKCEYDEITALKGVKSSLLTKKDGKLGLVDNIGATIIENTYTKIAPVSDKYEDGYIVTDSDKKMGVINHNKSTDVEVKYQDIKALGGNGKYVVKESGKWQVIDTEGNTYLKGKFDDVVSINGENVVIKNNGKYGVVTLSGDTKIATKYQEVKYLFDDKYIFKSENKYGVVNLEGEELIDPTYESLIYRADAGFLEGTKPNEVNTEFMDNSLITKLVGILTEINIDNGYMRVRIDNEYKYYNFKFEEKTNKEVLTTNTIFLDKKDGKYGFVNKNGIVVVDYIYDDAREQNEYGYASVKKNGMWGCVNQKGKVVITPAYQLENNSIIEFIGKWHLGEDLNLNYYTDK